MRKLDRTRPFGEVCGPSSDGHKYEQDGIIFGPDGVEMVPPVDTSDEWKEDFEAWKTTVRDAVSSPATPRMMWQWERVCPAEAVVQEAATVSGRLFVEDQGMKEKAGKKK
jgi:hypothetical protein